MADQQADTVIICSSELIANVMQEYFNKKMFKIAVEIVDLQTTESGYAFSLLFKENQKQAIVAEIHQDSTVSFPLVEIATGEWKVMDTTTKVKRDNKGRFEKRETVNEC